MNEKRSTDFKQKRLRLTIKVGRKIYHDNINQKKAGVAILIADKADF